MTGPVPKASVADSLMVWSDVVLPTAAKGAIIRRPAMLSLVDRLDADRRAVRRMQYVRDKYGRGPLLLSAPGQRRALVLAPQDVRRVLEETPESFTSATSEKIAALSHFEPKGALISRGVAQRERLRFNDRVLESDRPAHRLAARFLAVIDEEADFLRKQAQRRGALVWQDFHATWFRVIRRVVFGDGAADDRELIQMVERLRAAANWAFLHPGLPGLRARFLARVRDHLERAEPGSLAGVIAELPQSVETAPHHQVPQYLFAADPAGMAVFRTLALLAAHPDEAMRAQAEIAASPGPRRAGLPFLRSCVLESLRLWPTTPLVLRESVRETAWATGVLPARTGLLIFAPFFHRDDRNLAYADRFRPDLWLDGRGPAEWPLIPFSGGTQICPGRNFVLLLTSAMIAALLDRRAVRLRPRDRLRPARLPGTLSHFDLVFTLETAVPRVAGTAPVSVPAGDGSAPTPVRGVASTGRRAR